jgi:hypothetical protein
MIVRPKPPPPRGRSRSRSRGEGVKRRPPWIYVYLLPYALAIKALGVPEFWAQIGQTAASYPELTVGAALQNIFVAMPSDGGLTYLTTEFGRPFTAAGFGGWFRRRCNEAGLRGLSRSRIAQGCRYATRRPRRDRSRAHGVVRVDNVARSRTLYASSKPESAGARCVHKLKGRT